MQELLKLDFTFSQQVIIALKETIFNIVHDFYTNVVIV